MENSFSDGWNHLIQVCHMIQLAIIVAFLSILFQNAKSVTIIKEDILLLFDVEYRFRLS
mgnify:CR=1 FL=1